MHERCERCGGRDTYIDEVTERTVTCSFISDYCSVCGKDLCEKCMAEGCCKNVPAESGNRVDNN